MYKRFYFQGLASTVPSSLLFVVFPTVVWGTSEFLSKIGVIFLTIRFTSMLGSLSARLWHRFLSLKATSIACEVCSLFSLILLFMHSHLSTKYEAWGWALLLGLRSYLIGIIQTTRNTWLKGLDNQTEANKTAVNISTAQQSAFIFAGLVLIFFSNNPLIFSCMLSAEILFLFISIGLLTNLESPKIISSEIDVISKNSLSSFIKNLGSYVKILAIWIFLALSVGGTNTLLVNIGSHYFPGNIGYGLSICIYAISFYLGAKILSFLNKLKTGVYITFSAIMMTCFLLLGFEPGWVGASILLSVLFFLYGGLYSFLEGAWFYKIKNAHASLDFALKDIIYGLILAAGEYFYTKTHGYEMWIRAFSAFLMTYFIVLFSIEFKFITQKNDSQRCS